MILREAPKKVNETKNNRQKRYSPLEKARYAAFMLAREESEENRSNVSYYAAKEAISRTTLYKIRNELVNMLSGAKPGPKRTKSPIVESVTKSEAILPKLDIDLGNLGKQLSLSKQERLIRTILQMAISPASAREIRDVVREAFGIKISKSKIKKIINQYSNKAYSLLETIGAENKVKFLAIDEVFSGSRPILTGVELNSFSVVICEAAFNRNSETWQRVLRRFENLELVVSDQAKSIIKAVGDLDGVQHQWDIFHFKRDANRLLRHLESQAYKKIAKEYKAAKKLNKSGAEAQKNYEQLKRQALKVITLFDEIDKAMRIIYQCLDLFDSEKKLRDPQKSLKKLDRACDRLERASKNKKITNLAKRARSPHLLGYLVELNESLLSINISWQKGVMPIARNKVMQIVAKHWHNQKQSKLHLPFRNGESKVEWMKRREQLDKKIHHKRIADLLDLRYLQMSIKNFDEVFCKITSTLDRLFRASSLVESWNSQVRICQQVKKGLHRNFLALSVLHWNMTKFQEGKRKGKSPFQILGICTGESDWLDLLLTPLDSGIIQPSMAPASLQRA